MQAETMSGLKGCTSEDGMDATGLG